MFKKALLSVGFMIVTLLSAATGNVQDKSSARGEPRMKSSSPMRMLAAVTLGREHKVEFYEIGPGIIYVRESGNVSSGKPVFTSSDISRKNALELYQMLGPKAGPAPAALVEAVNAQKRQPRQPRGARPATIEESKPHLDADDLRDLREMGVDPAGISGAGPTQHTTPSWYTMNAFLPLGAACPWQSQFQNWMAGVGGPMKSSTCQGGSNVRVVSWGIEQGWGAFLSEQGKNTHIFVVKRFVPYYKFTAITSYGPGGFEVSGAASGCCDFDKLIHIVSADSGGLFDQASNYESD